MSDDAVRCSAEGCEAGATEILWLRDQPGHVHDCPGHAHDVREWCDVTASRPIADGRCSVVGCTTAPIWTGQPRPI